MATNCPQLLKPRACRSALCLPTAASKAVREISCNICEKMLHTLFKAESSSVCLSRRNLKLSETQPSTHLAAVRCQKLIWTRMMSFHTFLRMFQATARQRPWVRGVSGRPTRLVSGVSEYFRRLAFVFCRQLLRPEFVVQLVDGPCELERWLIGEVRRRLIIEPDV